MFKSQALIALAAIGSATLAFAAERSIGCFPSPDVQGFVDQGPNVFQSVGLCHSECETAGFPAFALNGTSCGCAQLDNVPGAEHEVDAAHCDTPCPGFASEKCGGKGGFVSVYTI
ncbi:uncharacterized protein PG998_003390 [Apiospora kogelbergensis]|uniref:WSC domain-containing protein n=1 Tax=Apiospora kogelbergensis TaxID=1337665 RepID=A0AAW0QV86_9PEZI